MAKRARTEWPTERVEALRRLVAEGLSYSIIAARFGVTRNSIVGVCDRNGIRSPNVPMAFTAEQIKTLRSLADAGMVATVIARQLGVSRDKVHAFCRRNQIVLFVRTGGRKMAAPVRAAPKNPQPRKATQRPEPVEAVPTEAISFMDLRLFRTDMANQCRRLLDGQRGMHGLVCAAATPPGKSYCPACSARLMVPVREPVRTQIVPRRRAA